MSDANDADDLGPMTCERFDEYLDDVALGMADEPLRADVLRHTDTCASCRARLDELSGLADRLLVLAPQIEPPAGFEQRVLDRLAPATLSVNGRRRGRPFVLLVLAAASIIVMAAWGGLVVGRHHRNNGEANGPDAAHPALAVAHSGVITTGTGRRLGVVSLVRGPTPHVLVTLDAPSSSYDRTGDVYCELQTIDGRAVRVGSWNYSDVQAGVWAAGISVDLLDAVSMRVVATDGTVMGTAVLA